MLIKFPDFIQCLFHVNSMTFSQLRCWYSLDRLRNFPVLFGNRKCISRGCTYTEFVESDPYPHVFEMNPPIHIFGIQMLTYFFCLSHIFCTFHPYNFHWFDQPINNSLAICLFTCWFGSPVANYKTTQVRGQQQQTKQEQNQDKKIKRYNLFKVQRQIERYKNAIHYYGHTVTGDKII